MDAVVSASATHVRMHCQEPKSPERNQRLQCYAYHLAKLDTVLQYWQAAYEKIALWVDTISAQKKAFGSTLDAKELRQGFDAKLYIYILRDLGRLYDSKGDTEQSIKFERQALDAHATHLGKQNHGYIDKTRSLVPLANEFPAVQALPLLLEALSIEDDIGARSPSEPYFALSTICRLLRELDRISDVPPYLERWIRLSRSEHRMEPAKLARDLITAAGHFFSDTRTQKSNRITHRGTTNLFGTYSCFKVRHRTA